MTNREQLKRHAGLLDQMASTRGVDLQETALAGDISIDEISDAVLRCSQCSNPKDCSRWLDQRSQSDHSPEYCENAEMLTALAAKQEGR